MSAGISEMYRQSGGSSSFNECGTCRYYAVDEDKIPRCKLHPFSKEHIWRDDYVACGYFEKKGREPKVYEEWDGQLKLF